MKPASNTTMSCDRPIIEHSRRRWFAWNETLEQLTHVQRQLVERKGSLKREVTIAERKLIARNERTMSLEALLQESQEKLTAANHQYVEYYFSRVPRC